MRWFAIVALALFSMAADAAFEKTDWNAAGDKLVTVDTSTGLEWLNLAATDNMSVGIVNAFLPTTFAGWRLPTNAEVVTMMNNMFDVSQSWSLELGTITARSPSHMNTGANRFATMMSNGGVAMANHLGLYYDENNVLRITGVYLNDYGAYAFIFGLENTNIYDYNSTLAVYNNIGGVMLVRDSVNIEPEPTPVPVMGGFGILGALSLMLVAGRRR